MRPRELILHGFRSYADATTISWEGRQLVGIVGPIGSGKSSILDGISFALYGKTPRLGTETVGLINQRRNEGKVSLTFSVGDSVWKVVRALRRKGPSAHALYRVEDGEDIEVSDKAREVTDKVEELLGLDYEGFSRSILLAQGQFAQFLDATSVERDKVLKGVFGFERIDAMREIAKSKRDRAGAGLSALERLREQAEQDRKTLETVTTEAEAATAIVGKLESASEPVAAADAEIAAAVAAATAAVVDRDALTALAERIPDRSATDELLGAVEGASQAVDQAEVAAQGATETEVTARAALDEAIAATGGREALAGARAVLARHTEQAVAASRAEAQTLQTAEDAAAGEVTATEAATAAKAAEEARKQHAVALAAAAEGAERVASALHEAQHRDLASTLRRDLADGDLCPVCEQEVAKVPSTGGTGLDEAAATHEAALASLAALRGEEATAVRDAASLKASAEAAATEVRRLVAAKATATGLATEASAAAAATRAELAALLGETDDPAGELERRATILSQAETAWEAARAAVASASQTVQAARTAAEGSSTRLDGLRTTLAALSERLGEVDLSGGPGVLGAALHRLREMWVARNAEIEASLEGIETGRVAATARRTAALTEVDLEEDADLAAAIAAAREQKASLEGRLADLAKRLEDLTRLEKEQADLVTQHDLYQRLVDDLLPSNFQKFLLDDRRRALAALGSERFEFLSAGRYRFTDDEKFEVIDLTAADLTRKAASLSGGETFLASLALALALAEIVAREGGRLDAFFLDEGFGSLDDEHVGLAMDGIERLVLEGQDRLIVVVSHVAGLRDRLEDLIVLAKDEVTGDTALRSGASAAG